MKLASFSYDVKWSDLDPIGHMRASAYVDITTDARVRALASAGYPVDRMVELGFGPVILRSECPHHREARSRDTLSVTVEPSALSDDGSHWIIRHRVFAADREKVATLTVQGTWLDLRTRQPTSPPVALLSSLRKLAGDGPLKRLRALAPMGVTREGQGE